MGRGTESTAYYLGRPIAELSEPYKGKDKVFAAVRLDGQRIANANFEHCTFANIHFKQVILEKSIFLHCVFIACYFRRAELKNAKFTGCKFIDCNFPHVIIKACDFRYSSFRGCQVPYSEMAYSLPSEPNLREEITRNLALESAALGLSSESRKYRLAGIRAREEHLSAAFYAKSQWYKDHFDIIARALALIQLSLSLLNRWFWGYGERSWALIRNLLLISLVLFPAVFYLFRHDLKHSSGGSVGLGQIFRYSIDNVIPGGIESGVVAVGGMVWLFAALESFCGIVAIALFASYIFRWSLHR